MKQIAVGDPVSWSYYYDGDDFPMPVPAVVLSLCDDGLTAHIRTAHDGPPGEGIVFRSRWVSLDDLGPRDQIGFEVDR